MLADVFCRGYALLGARPSVDAICCLLQGVEATLFATLMSIGNASMVASATLGSGLTALFGVTANNFTHLPALVLVCTLSRWLSLNQDSRFAARPLVPCR